MDDRQPVSLSILHVPISVSFGLFQRILKTGIFIFVLFKTYLAAESEIEESSLIVLDPSFKEEQSQSGCLTMIFDAGHFYTKKIGVSLSLRQMNECMELARRKAADWTKLIKSSVSSTFKTSKQRLEILTKRSSDEAFLVAVPAETIFEKEVSKWSIQKISKEETTEIQLKVSDKDSSENVDVSETDDVASLPQNNELLSSAKKQKKSALKIVQELAMQQPNTSSVLNLALKRKNL